MRGSTTRSDRGGWRGGTAPPRSRQTGREPLDSSGLPLRSGCRGLIPVTGLAKPPSRSPRPLLQSHYSPFIATTPQSAPVRRIRYSRLRLSASAYSRSHRFPVRPRHDWFPSSIQEPTPRSCPLYAGHRLAKSELTPPGLSQGRASALVLMSSFYFSTRHRKVRFRSTPWCLPDRGSPAVSCNAQDPRS